MPLVQTDYGLIYNTDGTLYATLRPGEGRFGGAVAVEEGTTNLVPSNRLKFEGWSVLSGAQVTLTQNVEFPEIGRNDATRIRTTGGTSTLKYYISIERSIADQAYTGSVYIKNIGSKPVRFGTQRGPVVTVNPGEWTRAISSGIGNGTTNFQLRFEALNVDDDLDFIAWGPQTEHKPFATSFVDGTRAAGRLAYPTSFNMDEGTIHVWFYFNGTTAWNTSSGTIFRTKQGSGGLRNHFWLRTSTEDGHNSLRFQVRRDNGSNIISHNIKHFSDISDGWHSAVVRWSTSAQSLDVFLDGQLLRSYTYPIDGLLPFDAIDVGCRDTVSQSNTLLDELLILPYAADEQEIQSWYQNGITHVRKPGYYASFDDSLALQYWSEVTYDYRVQNNRVIFTEAPKPEDHVLVLYETGI